MAASKYVKLPAAIHDVRRYLSSEFTKVAESISGIVDLLNPLEQEFGTWQPTLFGITSAGVTTYTLQEGFYVKTGKIVVVSGRVHWSAATGTGAARVGGLPFESAFIGSVANYWAGSCYGVTITATRTLIVPDSTMITLLDSTGTAGSPITASGQLVFSSTYWTD